jgi:hypothetical protein
VDLVRLELLGKYLMGIANSQRIITNDFHQDIVASMQDR